METNWRTLVGIVLVGVTLLSATRTAEYEILIVEKGTGSSLRDEYVGVFVPRDTVVCNTRAYLHYTTKTLFYYTPTYWCFTSASYNTISGCKNGRGFYYTTSFNSDPLKSTFTTTIDMYEGCLVPEVDRATKVTSSHANGAKLGEKITVSCPGIGDRKFTCQAGNRWEPPDVAGACFDSDQFNIVDRSGSDGGSSGLLLYKGGTVCDDRFNRNAANAVCSLLGYEASGSEWTSGSRWDIQGEYSITLDDVNCRSSSWSSCTYSEYPIICYHREDVFLTCTSREDSDLFNMVDENGADGGSSGLLLYKGGTVCDDHFDQNAADAICSLLGYKASGSEWTSGRSWNIQYGYSITLCNVNCRSSSWSSCTYTESHDSTHSEDVFLTCRGKKLSAIGIIGIIAAVLVGIFIGVLLYRKRKQRRSSRQCEMEQPRESDTIPSAPVPQPADNVQEGPGTEAAVSIPALGASNLSPPSYRETVSEHGEDKVPTYEDVMANENIYDIAH